MTERDQRGQHTRQPGSSQPTSEGDLTARRTLRVGVMRRGQLAEERLVPGGRAVTIGAAESNSFVLPTDELGASFVLLEPKKSGDGYILNFTDQMSGRIATDGEPQALADLKSQATSRKREVFSLSLPESARGKVTVGNTSFLIQFVRPTPPSARTQLPPRMLSGSNSLDWSVTIIAAFSFLFHFGAIGVFYSDWADRVLDDESSLVGLVDRIQRLPPPPIETPQTPKDEDKGTQQAKDAKAAAAAQGAKAAAGPAKAAVSKSEGAALLNKLDQMDAATIGALVSSGAATQGVLKDGNVPTGALDDLASAASGVGALGPGGLRVGGGGGPVVPGGGAGLANLGSGSGAEGTTGTSGAGTKVEGPKGNVSGGGSVSMGKVSGADRVLAAARGRIRACYQSGLNTDPEMGGKVSFALTIGASGSVSSANVTPSGNITAAVISCIQAILQGLNFDAPEEGAASINGSFSFVNSTKGK